MREGHGLLDVWMSHGDKVTQVPPGFKVIASNAATPDRRHGGRVAQALWRAVPSGSDAYAAGTRHSRALSACHLRARFGLEHARLHRRGRRRIRSQVGSEEVILGLSGGVDSAVAAALIHRAIGDQLTCVFVDTGLLRLNEAEQVHGDLRAATSA